MKWRRLFSTIAIVIYFISFLMMMACVRDSFPNFTGNVYEWIDAPNGEFGSIYIDSEFPDSITARPVPNASIQFYYKNIPPMGPSCSTEIEKEEYIRLLGIASDSEGKFDINETLAYGSYPLKISTNAEGYYPIEKIFTYHGNSTFNILLVRN